MIEEKSWEEFKNIGLLWWINTILHMFGWAIVYEVKDDNVLKVYPARVKYRGFAEEMNSKGYKKVSDYLKENISELTKEANDQW